MIVCGAMAGFPFTNTNGLPDSITPQQIIVGATHLLNMFLPIVFGILMADRLPRDRRLNTLELLDSLPVGSGSRLWGKYLGASLATALPLGLVYFGLAAILAVQRHAPVIVALEIPSFVLMVLPGLIFVGAFSIACTLVLPVPIYSALLIGYWFWGNVVSPERIPTLTCTPLTPIGGFAAHGLLGLQGSVCDGIIPPITPAQGWMSIALLLAVAILALAVTQTVMSFRTSHT
jgi:ABC-type Na+ efflux pump permease subunit